MIIPLLLILLLEAAFLAGIILFLIIEIYAIVIGPHKGAPFIRSRKEKIKIMLELAEVSAGELVIDLGSGDGTILLEAAKHGARAVGIEFNPFLCWYARWRIRRTQLKNKITVIKRDFYNYPLEDADVIFLYLWPSTVKKLEDKLSRELKPGTRIVSNAFALPDWNYILEKNQVYLYEKNPKLLAKING